MLEARGEADLALEALGAECLLEFLAEDLEGDGTAVLQVLGEVDRRHAALAQLALDAVAVSERGEAGRGRHWETGIYRAGRAGRAGGRVGRVVQDWDGLDGLEAVRPTIMVMLSVPPSSSASLQQVLADLARRRHGAEPLGDALVGDVLEEAVAAEQAHLAPELVHLGDHGRGGVAADGAGENVGPAGARGIGAIEDALVDELLRHGLVAGDLDELVVAHDVAAAVTHLQEVGAGPDADPEGEGGGHAALHILVLGVLEDGGVDLHRGVGEGVGEGGVAVALGGVIGLDALGDVLGDALDGEAARLLAGLGAADAIGDHAP